MALHHPGGSDGVRGGDRVPKDYEAPQGAVFRGREALYPGRVSIGDDPVGKLVCERAAAYWGQRPGSSGCSLRIWSTYKGQEREILDILEDSEGKDKVVIYLKKERAKKILPPQLECVCDGELTDRLIGRLGEKNVRVVQKEL